MSFAQAKINNNEMIERLFYMLFCCRLSIVLLIVIFILYFLSFIHCPIAEWYSRFVSLACVIWCNRVMWGGRLDVKSIMLIIFLHPSANKRWNGLIWWFFKRIHFNWKNLAALSIKPLVLYVWPNLVGSSGLISLQKQILFTTNYISSIANSNWASMISITKTKV